MKYIPAFLLLLFLSVLLNSCKFSRLLKNPEIEAKYEAAIKYYNEKDYSRALQLFEQMTGAIRATDKAEDMYYFYAYCYYHQHDYTLASYYFKRFYTNFPNTSRAEECLFMSAYCNYMNSPEYSLDQTSTYDAIKELQLFMNIFPKSKRVPECNDLVDKMREKLEYKDYRIAKLYLRMEDYAAAITCFNSILKDFPETSHKEEIMFLFVKAYHKYAMMSIFTKRAERHRKAIQAYNDLEKEYPQSRYLQEAGLYADRSRKDLGMIVSKE